MAIYEIGAATVAAATGAAYSTVKGDTAKSAFLKETSAYCNAATASSVLLGRPANTPVDTTTTVLNAVNPDASSATSARHASTWSTAPTTPTVVFRRITLPATIGAGFIWVWNPGDEPVTSKTAGTTNWFVWWNFGAGAGSVLNQYVKILE